MGDPKDHVTAAAPKKGEKCELCQKLLDSAPSIAVQYQVPLVFKKIAKRGCLSCAKELRSLLDLRIDQAEKGVYQS